ncbi:MAG: hypothetical protein EOO10_20445, partial [Chitinophagaceae bacterium]
MKRVSNMGPQYAGDNSFTKNARELQSIYRASFLNEHKCGLGPTKNAKNRYGNMLVNGEESGKNFILPSTFEYAKFRLLNKKKEETIDAYRLFNNMLSSMPLCFNLFHPLQEMLRTDPQAVTTIFKHLFPGLPIFKVTDIKIEYVPSPIHNYLGDKTAFDAAVFFEREEDEKFLLAIETKYVEPLGTNPPSNPSKHISFANTLSCFTEQGSDAVAANCSQVY